MIREYYDGVWARKLSLPQYATKKARWRSRWEFARDRIASGSRVLDAACGDGVLGEILARDKSCDVVGVDISDTALKHARERGVRTLSCDIARDRFPVEDGSCDYVTFLCSLEHIFDPGHALREAVRVLKPDGEILVTLPNAVQFRFRWDFFRGRLSRDLLHTGDGEGLHVRFFDYHRELEALVASEVPGLTLVTKIPSLKNPLAGSGLGRGLRSILMRGWPNLFAEYVHYVLEKWRAA